MRVHILAPQDDQILAAACDEQLVVGLETEVARSQPFDALALHKRFRRSSFRIPIAAGHTRSRDPDFPYPVGGLRLSGHRVHDPDLVSLRSLPAPDQRNTCWLFNSATRGDVAIGIC